MNAKTSKPATQTVVRFMMDNLVSGLQVFVRSADSGKLYVVRKLGIGQWTCSCKDFQFRGGEMEVGSNGKPRKHICKHMKALFAGTAEVDGVTVNAEVNEAARKVSEWSAN